MSIFLKVKIKSLAEESRIIRTEESRARTSTLRSELRDHRRQIVRSETRHSLLAYGYLRGRSANAIEAKAHREPNWERVERMIKKYGPGKNNLSFEDWRKDNEQETKSDCGAAA